MRKYQEFFMSIAVEQNYSKDEILDMYLNSVYFGENVFEVFSTVLDESRDGRRALSFADDPRLINVAVSRAKERFS